MTFLAKGCSVCQGSCRFCSAPSKTARDAEPQRFPCTHSAMASADIYPQQLWGRAVPPGSSAGHLNLCGWRCLPTQHWLLPWKARQSLEEKGREREQQGVRRFICQMKTISSWCQGHWRIHMMIAEVHQLEKLRTGNRSGYANNRLNVADFKWQLKHCLIKD